MANGVRPLGWLWRKYRGAIDDGTRNLAVLAPLPPPPPEVIVTLPPGTAIWPEQRQLAARRLFPQESVWPNPALQPQAGQPAFGPNALPPGASLWPDKLWPRRTLYPMPDGWWNAAPFFAGFAPAPPKSTHLLPLFGAGPG